MCKFNYFRRIIQGTIKWGKKNLARETIARVIAGAFAKMALKHFGVSVNAGLVGVGEVKAEIDTWNPPFRPPLYAPKGIWEEMMRERIEEARRAGRSECVS